MGFQRKQTWEITQTRIMDTTKLLMKLQLCHCCEEQPEKEIHPEKETPSCASGDGFCNDLSAALSDAKYESNRTVGLSQHSNSPVSEAALQYTFL